MEFTEQDDAKLATLARATRARAHAAEGACVRDRTGRTYAGATVALASLQVSAVGVAVAMTVSSGGDGLEAVAVVTTDALSDDDLAVIREYAGQGVLVYRCGPDGAPVEQVRT